MKQRIEIFFFNCFSVGSFVPDLQRLKKIERSLKIVSAASTLRFAGVFLAAAFFVTGANLWFYLATL
jgi:hypothetical protein